MQDKRFSWNENKNDANVQKHGIDFFEAATVFDDDSALYFFDEKHSAYEERFIIIGISKQLNMLVVCHCYRNGESLTRLISARKANKKEIARYKGGGK